MSRPKRSVPKGCAHEGALSASATFISVGSYGAITPANAASTMRARTRMLPKTTRRLRSVGCRPARHRDIAAGGLVMTTLSTADPRVDGGVEQIHGEVAQHEERADEEDGALHERIIPLDHRAQEQAAHPGQGEDFFGDHRAPEEIADLDARHRAEGDAAVLQGVPPHHAPLGEPFGASGPDEVLPDNLEPPG